MRRDELRQTRSDMLDLAAERGYSAKELGLLANGYRLAQAMTDAGYRPCGRPFINHLLGVACVLIHYGFKIDLVLTGLLHTFYSHGPSHANGLNAAVEMVRTLLGGSESPVEKRVRAYTLRNGDFSEFLKKPASQQLIADAEIFILAAAICIEINLSGEIRYSSRKDLLSAEYKQALTEACDLVGVPGLATTFAEIDRLAAVPAELNTRINQSYRLLDDKKQAVPMSNNLLAAQQKLNANQTGNN
jgi:hypothetical protein